MRLPHYIVCSPSGTWHFCQRVSTDLHVVLGTKCLKRSLRTRDPLVAQRLALGVASYLRADPSPGQRRQSPITDARCSP